MKRNLIPLIISMIMLIVTLCASLYFVCHHNSEQAVIIFLFFICSAICFLLSYRSFQIVREVKSKYEYMNNEDKAAEYFALIPPNKIELYLASLSNEEIKAEEEKYLSRCRNLERRHDLSREQKTRLLNDCKDILYYIKKAKG